jgi:hypothetical protein
VEALLLDLGLVLAHTAEVRPRCARTAAVLAPAIAPVAASSQPRPHCMQGAAVKGWEHAVIARKARRLLLFACDMGWAAVAASVLPLASASCSCAAEMVAAVHEAPLELELEQLMALNPPCSRATGPAEAAPAAAPQPGCCGSKSGSCAQGGSEASGVGWQ